MAPTRAVRRLHTGFHSLTSRQKLSLFGLLLWTTAQHVESLLPWLQPHHSNLNCIPGEVNGNALCCFHFPSRPVRTRSLFPRALVLFLFGHSDFSYFSFIYENTLNSHVSLCMSADIASCLYSFPF